MPLRQRRKLIVGFVEVETPSARMFRMAAQGITDAHEKPQTALRQINGQGEQAPTYWCAADKPDTDDTLAVRPVYRTNTVPADAECEVCGISIRELQTMIGEAFSG